MNASSSENIDLVKEDVANVGAETGAGLNKSAVESDVVVKVSRELRDEECVSVPPAENLDQMMNDVDLLFSAADTELQSGSSGMCPTEGLDQDQVDKGANVLERAPAVADLLEEREDSSIVSSHDSLRSSDFEQLNVGSWVEGFDENDVRFRAKLAAVTRPNDVHIFVNRAGLKKLELTRAELNKRIAAHKIKILDNGALFDRALQSVIGSLREYKKPEFH